MEIAMVEISVSLLDYNTEVSTYLFDNQSRYPRAGEGDETVAFGDASSIIDHSRGGHRRESRKELPQILIRGRQRETADKYPVMDYRPELRRVGRWKGIVSVVLGRVQ